MVHILNPTSLTVKLKEAEFIFILMDLIILESLRTELSMERASSFTNLIK